MVCLRCVVILWCHFWQIRSVDTRYHLGTPGPFLVLSQIQLVKEIPPPTPEDQMDDGILANFEVSRHFRKVKFL